MTSELQGIWKVVQICLGSFLWKLWMPLWLEFSSICLWLPLARPLGWLPKCFFSARLSRWQSYALQIAWNWTGCFTYSDSLLSALWRASQADRTLVCFQVVWGMILFWIERLHRDIWSLFCPSSCPFYAVYQTFFPLFDQIINITDITDIYTPCVKTKSNTCLWSSFS